VPIGVPIFLQKLYKDNGVPENTDQGSQYTSEVLHQCIKQWNKNFYGRYEQHFIERLWRTILNVYLQAYTDGISLYRGLKDYFEFYNTRRLHQSLDYGTYNNYYKSGIKSE
jgi:putative transposase